MPKISVIIGIFNVGDTLAEALDSLLSQTFQDFNVILCDDGSSDNTVEIAQQYCMDFPGKFILLRNEHNMGLNYTLNKCLDAADGEYIARMDGDDLCVPTRFEKQVAFLDQHPEYAIVSTAMTHFDENGVYRISRLKEYPGKLDFIKENPFCHAPVMIRAEAYRAVGGYTVDVRMLRVEDVDLWFKLYAAGYKGHNIQEPLYMMRDDREASSRRKFKYRVNSTYARIKGFKSLNIPFHYYPNTLRPILVGLLPKPLYTYLHKRRNKIDPAQVSAEQNKE